MDGDILRRDFLFGAGAATSAAVLAQDALAEPMQLAAAETPLAPEAPDVGKFVALHQIVKAAKARMSVDAWTYLTGGVETETTLKRNRQALDSIALKPRVLRGVTKVDHSHEFLGYKLRIPVMLSAIGSIGRMDPGGAGTAAKAASKFGVPLAVSSVAKPGYEAAAAAAPDTLKIYQLYVRGDDAWVDDVAKKVMDSGFNVFGFTVDSAVFSRRERDMVLGGINAEGSDHPDPYTSGLTWDNIKRFRDRHPNIKISVKGITTAEDAELALESGVDIVWVSTHGGRQLDHGWGSMQILPEVVDTVRGRAKIIADSGISRGTDVVKAICLGADMVAIGKLYCYGVGAGGEAGITRVLEILEKEVVEVMSLMGAHSLAQLNRSCLRVAQPVVPPGVFSAFPLLETA